MIRTYCMKKYFQLNLHIFCYFKILNSYTEGCEQGFTITCQVEYIDLSSGFHKLILIWTNYVCSQPNT